MDKHLIGENDRNYNPDVIALPSTQSTEMYDNILDVETHDSEDINDEEKRIDWLCDGRTLQEDVYLVSDKCKKTNVMLKLLPLGTCRTGQRMKTDNKFIVLHETNTGSEKSPVYKNQLYYSLSLKINNNVKDGVGFHFLCDDDTVICFIPWDEITYHAGSRKFNYTSIGIERMVRAGISFPDALHNQAKLTATLMYMCNIPLRRVITHFNATYAAAMPYREGEAYTTDENGNRIRVKNCPSRMLEHQYGGEQAFYTDIVNCLRKKDLFLSELRDMEKNINRSRAIASRKKTLTDLNELLKSIKKDSSRGK